MLLTVDETRPLVTLTCLASLEAPLRVAMFIDEWEAAKQRR